MKNNLSVACTASSMGISGKRRPIEPQGNHTMYVCNRLLFYTLRSRRLEVVGARSFLGLLRRPSYFIVNVLDLPFASPITIYR